MLYDLMFQRYRPTMGYEDCSAYDILSDIEDNIGSRLAGKLFSKGVIDAEEFLDVTQAYRLEYIVK